MVDSRGVRAGAHERSYQEPTVGVGAVSFLFLDVADAEEDSEDSETDCSKYYEL